MSEGAGVTRLSVIDSHTEGEPTRVVIDGFPALPGATMPERRDAMRAAHDALRRAIVAEPRGHEAMVGAVLTPPVRPDAVAGIIFFNTGTYLGMCGHGLMGVVRTLHHLGRLEAGVARFDTPAGPVSAELDAGGCITIRNVPARCTALDVEVEVPGLGRVRGDIAYGGNWFFLTESPSPLDPSRVGELTREATRIQEAIDAAGLAGDDGPIDHVELAGPPARPDADARNFVLCSGGAYDRSPCGTGTSAVMAARHARGELAPGERWHQESITGSLFTGWLERDAHGALVPFIRGRAFITAEAELRFDPDDPFRHGLP